jgi:hypothetical protein
VEFDDAYFADLIPKAGEYIYNWYLDPEFVDENDVISGPTQKYGWVCNFYAVNVPGITTMEELRQQSHQYFTYDVIAQQEVGYIEQDGKLYLPRAGGLGGDGYSWIYVDSEKVSDTQYLVTVYGKWGFQEGTEVETVNYVLEDGQWVFDAFLIGASASQGYTIDQMPQE